MKKTFKHLPAVIFLALMLAACGGGGGGGGGGNAAPAASTTTTSTGTSTRTGTGTGIVTSSSTAISNNTAYVPADPLFADQWHLKNTGQKGAKGVAGTSGEDLNVEKVWTTYKGSGQRIAIVDGGLDFSHEDLAANVAAGASWDYTTGAAPTGNLLTGTDKETQFHGTACGGLAAAVEGNGKGGVGVAMAANLVGYNLLQSDSTANESDAMTRGNSTNSVSTNSWGAADGTGTLQAPPSAWETAIGTGITSGRGGKGVVYIWAAGNGYPYDRSDYDGQANYQGVIAVAALNDIGHAASYSEQGSNVLISAYGGEFCDTHTLTTTDIAGSAGGNAGLSTSLGGLDYSDANYTKCMNGTSGATPEVAGAVALMFEANPNLTYRDVRIILATTARKNAPTNVSWMLNGAGLHINDNYGYGAVDTFAAVNAALAWVSVGGSGTLVTLTGRNGNAAAIPGGTGTATSPVYGAAATSAIALAKSGIGKIEFVDVTINSDHAEFGDLKITLTSPMGTVSTLALPHNCVSGSLTAPCGNLLLNGFRFGVARLINESANGVWTLSVSDGKAGKTGNLTAWGITVYGH